MSQLDGKLLIVTSSPGVRDTIYIGYSERHGDMLCLTRASMILRYESVGVPGIAGDPSMATKLRPVTSPDATVWLPMSSMAALVVADPQAWESHLGISRG